MCAKNGVIRFLILFVVKNLICQHYFCIINVILQEIELGFPKLMYNISTFYHNLIDYMSFTAIAGSPSENYEMLQWIIKHIKSISRILFSRKIWPKIFAFCVSISFTYLISNVPWKWNLWNWPLLYIFPISVKFYVIKISCLQDSWNFSMHDSVWQFEKNA